MRLPRRNLLKLLGAAPAAVAARPAAAAADSSWPPPVGKQKIVYLSGPWTNALALTYIGKSLLERMGYSVEVRQIVTGPAFAAMADGTADVWSAGFLPGQFPILKKYESKLDLLSISYLPVPFGLAVPDYVNISSIDELNDPGVKAKMGDKIVGIEPGSGGMLLSATAVKDYGLQYQLVPGSSAAMAAAFKAAYDKKQWIVATIWKPHNLWAECQMKFLSDPKGAYGDAERDFHIARSGFRNDSPRAAAFFYRFTFHSDQLSKLMADIGRGQKPEEVAATFIQQHPDLVYFWAHDLIPGFQKPASLA